MLITLPSMLRQQLLHIDPDPGPEMPTGRQVVLEADSSELLPALLASLATEADINVTLKGRGSSISASLQAVSQQLPHLQHCSFRVSCHTSFQFEKREDLSQQQQWHLRRVEIGSGADLHVLQDAAAGLAAASISYVEQLDLPSSNPYQPWLRVPYCLAGDPTQVLAALPEAWVVDSLSAVCSPSDISTIHHKFPSIKSLNLMLCCTQQEYVALGGSFAVSDATQQQVFSGVQQFTGLTSLRLFAFGRPPDSSSSSVHPLHFNHWRLASQLPESFPSRIEVDASSQQQAPENAPSRALEGVHITIAPALGGLTLDSQVVGPFSGAVALSAYNLMAITAPAAAVRNIVNMDLAGSIEAAMGGNMLTLTYGYHEMPHLKRLRLSNIRLPAPAGPRGKSKSQIILPNVPACWGECLEVDFSVFPGALQLVNAGVSMWYGKGTRTLRLRGAPCHDAGTTSSAAQMPTTSPAAQLPTTSSSAQLPTTSKPHPWALPPGTNVDIIVPGAPQDQRSFRQMDNSTVGPLLLVLHQVEGQAAACLREPGLEAAARHVFKDCETALDRLLQCREVDGAELAKLLMPGAAPGSPVTPEKKRKADAAGGASSSSSKNSPKRPTPQELQAATVALANSIRRSSSPVLARLFASHGAEYDASGVARATPSPPASPTFRGGSPGGVAFGTDAHQQRSRLGRDAAASDSPPAPGASQRLPAIEAEGDGEGPASMQTSPDRGEPAPGGSAAAFSTSGAGVMNAGAAALLLTGQHMPGGGSSSGRGGGVQGVTRAQVAPGALPPEAGLTFLEGGAGVERQLAGQQQQASSSRLPLLGSRPGAGTGGGGAGRGAGASSGAAGSRLQQPPGPGIAQRPHKSPQQQSAANPIAKQQADLLAQAARHDHAAVVAGRQADWLAAVQHAKDARAARRSAEQLLALLGMGGGAGAGLGVGGSPLADGGMVPNAGLGAVGSGFLAAGMGPVGWQLPGSPVAPGLGGGAGPVAQPRQQQRGSPQTSAAARRAPAAAAGAGGSFTAAGAGGPVDPGAPGGRQGGGQGRRGRRGRGDQGGGRGAGGVAGGGGDPGAAGAAGAGDDGDAAARAVLCTILEISDQDERTKQEAAQSLINWALPHVKDGTLHWYLYLPPDLFGACNDAMTILMRGLLNLQQQLGPEQITADTGADNLAVEEALSVLQAALNGLAKACQLPWAAHAVAWQVYIPHNGVGRGIAAVLGKRWATPGSAAGLAARMQTGLGPPSPLLRRRVMLVDQAAAQQQAQGQLCMPALSAEDPSAVSNPVYFESACSTLDQVRQLAAAAAGYFVCSLVSGGVPVQPQLAAPPGAGAQTDVCALLPAGQPASQEEMDCVNALLKSVNTGRAPQRLDCTGTPAAAASTEVLGEQGWPELGAEQG